ncbi:Photosystem I reaction center subunit N, chloroplastic-like protein, partial [Drosera capensis]
ISTVKPAAVSSKVISLSTGSLSRKFPVIKAQQQEHRDGGVEGRRTAVLGLAAALFATAVSSAQAGIIENYLEISKANKELNDKKRLATSGANFARAYTVQFGSCKFPENFTGCQDLAKQKKVPFLTDDLELECEGKDKYKYGSNVFWTDLFDLKMKKRADFNDHIAKFNQLITQLETLDMKVDNDDQALILLKSLNSYSALKTTLLVGKDKLRVEEVTAAVFDINRLNPSGSSSQDE